MEFINSNQLSNLSGANLRGANLQGKNLRGANLTRAILIGANLQSADLEDANLQDANLFNANLEDASLRGANLRGANLRGTNLQDADLQDANLNTANLRGANLRGAFLRRARMRFAILSDANLTAANLSGVNLSGVILTGANLTDIIGANLTGAIGANLTGQEIQPPVPIQGVAFEVHNVFASFAPKKEEYLNIIQQPDKSYGDIYNYIKETFTQQINQHFSDNKDAKLNELTTVLTKISGRIPEEDKDLIGKTIDFAFSQDENFIKEYIKTFLDETCKAYTGKGDITSCVKGIIERFIINIGSTAQILCAGGCENEQYKKLDKLFYNKLDLNAEAEQWFQLDEVKNMSEIQDVTKRIQKRKEHFINHMIQRARELQVYNETLEEEIKKYATSIEYSFGDLQLGGSRKTNKSKKRRKTKKSKKQRKTRKSKTSRKSRKSKKQK